MRILRARLTGSAAAILQCALAASLSWLGAREMLGHDAPFFAPIAAIIALGATFGQRGRRAVELVAGVALGILVADLLILAIGTGTAQIAAVVVLAMTLSVALGGGPILVTQAAASAVLVATLQPPEGAIDPSRALDALLGGVVALVVASVVLPANPVRLAREAAAPLLVELSGSLEDIALALDHRDLDRAEAALLRARAIDPLAVSFREALDVARETTVVAPPRRGARPHLDAYAGAAGQIDLAVGNVRVLARGVIRALQVGDSAPPEVAGAVRDLAEAVLLLGTQLAEPAAEGLHDARPPAIRAAGRATAVLEQTANLSVSVLIGQIRSTAVDLLRGTGMELAEAQAAVREAAADPLLR